MSNVGGEGMDWHNDADANDDSAADRDYGGGEVDMVLPANFDRQRSFDVDNIDMEKLFSQEDAETEEIMWEEAVKAVVGDMGLTPDAAAVQYGADAFPPQSPQWAYSQQMGQMGQLPRGSMYPPNPAAYGYYPYPQMMGAPPPQGYEQCPHAMHGQYYPPGAPPAAPPAALEAAALGVRSSMNEQVPVDKNAPPPASPAALEAAADSLHKNALGMRRSMNEVDVGGDDIVNGIGMYLFIYVDFSELFVVQSNVNIILPYFYIIIIIDNEVSNLREVILNEGLHNEVFDCCTSSSSITLPFYNNLGQGVSHGVPRESRFTFPTISIRLGTLIQTGHWEDIESEVNGVRGVVEWCNGELFVSAQTMGSGNNCITAREDIGKLVKLISYYEIKEATSLLELALWKVQLDQVDKANPIPRRKCRIDVPGPVKDMILQYLHERQIKFNLSTSSGKFHVYAGNAVLLPYLIFYSPNQSYAQQYLSPLMPTTKKRHDANHVVWLNLVSLLLLLIIIIIMAYHQLSTNNVFLLLLHKVNYRPFPLPPHRVNGLMPQLVQYLKEPRRRLLEQSNLYQDDGCANLLRVTPICVDLGIVTVRCQLWGVMMKQGSNQILLPTHVNYPLLHQMWNLH